MAGGTLNSPAANGSLDSIVETVLTAVLAGELVPGQRLPERWLVEACGCTHTGAREAISRLQSLGAVVVPERRGASVISRREAPPDEVDRVWRQLTPLLEAAAGPLPTQRPADGWARLTQEQAALERARPAAGDRLIDTLKRVSLQRAIVAAR